MDSDSTAARELEVKGALQSSTITATIMMMGSFLVGKLVEHSTNIQLYLIDLLPDMLDPYVGTVWDFLIGLLLIFFGKKAIAGRVKVGDIKGLY